MEDCRTIPRLFVSYWPNHPALAEMTVRGRVVVANIARESEMIAHLSDPLIGDAILVPISFPRWAIRLPPRVRVVLLGRNVFANLRDIALHGRYKQDGGWVWTPTVLELSILVNTPVRWSFELTDAQRSDGRKPDGSVEPRPDRDERCGDKD
tara:strand:- start:4157 stop:4612 length:456 start_codon:yes stop_codon:yes gene_type:complete